MAGRCPSRGSSGHLPAFMKLEYSKQESANDDLKYVVYYEDKELHVVIEADSEKTLEQVLKEYFKTKDLELVLKEKDVV